MGESSDPMHGHYILGKHRKILKHPCKLVDIQFSSPSSICVQESLFEIRWIILEQIVQADNTVIVIQVVLTRNSKLIVLSHG